MSARLHLAGPEDLEQVVSLVTLFHEETGITLDDDTRLNGVLPILSGSPHGAVWLIGPRSSAIGYIVVSFGWSLKMGGLDGFVDELFVRKGVRGRGIGTEALAALRQELGSSGLKALHLEVAHDNTRACNLYAKLGFKARDRFHLMTWAAR